MADFHEMNQAIHRALNHSAHTTVHADANLTPSSRVDLLSFPFEHSPRGHTTEHHTQTVPQLHGVG